MTEIDYRFRELERRMDRAESAAERVPVINATVATIADDVRELKDDQKSLRRALYTMAISVAGSAVIFVYGVTELFK